MDMLLTCIERARLECTYEGNYGTVLHKGTPYVVVNLM